MITLYGVPRTRSLRVSWLLEELGLEWDYQFIDFASGYNRSPEFLAINPCGKVPALVDGELCLTESAGICQFLAERYGKEQWLPAPGSEAAANYHRWFSFIITELEQPLWNRGKHKFALPEEHRVEGMLLTAEWEFEQAANIAENWLPDTPYLTGDQPTVVDILLAHTLNWAANWSIPLPTKLNAFRKRMSSRPALAAALSKEMAGAGKA